MGAATVVARPCLAWSDPCTHEDPRVIGPVRRQARWPGVLLAPWMVSAQGGGWPGKCLDAQEDDETRQDRAIES